MLYDAAVHRQRTFPLRLMKPFKDNSLLSFISMRGINNVKYIIYEPNSNVICFIIELKKKNVLLM